MALTRLFKDTVQARVSRDAAFRKTLLSEAIELLLEGDWDASKAMLRDYVNATLGFERLSELTGIPIKSLHRMLGSKGNPTLANFSAILEAIGDAENMAFHIRVQQKSARGAMNMTS